MSESSNAPDDGEKQQPKDVTQDRKPERSAIADAIAARLTVQDDDDRQGALAESKERTSFCLKVRRTINALCGSITYEKAFACLQLTHTLLDNVVRHPDESKYRTFRAQQPKIARDVLSLPEAVSLLVEAGFRKRTRDFQEEWFVPPSDVWTSTSLGMKRLAWTRDMIGERMGEYKESAERVQMQKERERAFEQNRKARALAEAQDDRERVALRIQREKAARKAAEEKQAASSAAEKEQEDEQSQERKN